MAPRTRQSQTKASVTVESTPGQENKAPISFENSKVNTSTRSQSRVPARRVLPGSKTQAGKSNHICKERGDLRIRMISTWETHL
jgi:hypothetical protein